ncbi:MAG: ketol-acid reductoisomerase, partial [Methanobrevibacter sp.]|nr:ketol-acid reductoisomerase [Methanobrevibacter sp.]
HRIINDEAKDEMKKILREIQRGKFAKEWTLESIAKMPMLNRMRTLESEKKIEQVGSKLRKACGLEKKDE